eukprot:TRINITY_DN12972_c0_g1_i3.p2 TRINITY_DN12972_c0_g1~~TRINITY_DN12972_c0_g1_i3.p2  ORF type:complete len:191 (-),score=-16.66 TRINITY_DN12972_c0_g1_i3:28-600(-)
MQKIQKFQIRQDRLGYFYFQIIFSWLQILQILQFIDFQLEFFLHIICCTQNILYYNIKQNEHNTQNIIFDGDIFLTYYTCQKFFSTCQSILQICWNFNGYSIEFLVFYYTIKITAIYITFYNLHIALFPHFIHKLRLVETILIILNLGFLNAFCKLFLVIQLVYTSKKKTYQLCTSSNFVKKLFYIVVSF